MGHPDPSRFAKFLKGTHADLQIVAGSLDFNVMHAANHAKDTFLRVQRPFTKK